MHVVRIHPDITVTSTDRLKQLATQLFFQQYFQTKARHDWPSVWRINRRPFLSQIVSNAESISLSWRHYDPVIMNYQWNRQNSFVQFIKEQGFFSIQRCRLTGIGIPIINMIKITRSHDRLIFMMEIPLPGNTPLYWDGVLCEWAYEGRWLYPNFTHIPLPLRHERQLRVGGKETELLMSWAVRGEINIGSHRKISNTNTTWFLSLYKRGSGLGLGSGGGRGGWWWFGDLRGTRKSTHCR